MRGIQAEILIMGGAAMALLFNARNATRDVDAIFVRPAGQEISEAAARVAATIGLPSDWMNDAAKGYLHGLEPGEIVWSSANFIVRALAVPQLLAMKLSAWRDDVDIADARVLLAQIKGSRREIWALIEPFLVPGRELKARYAFEDLWDSENGPR